MQGQASASDSQRPPAATHAARTPRDMIEWTEEEGLRWYYGEAQALFERSPAGSVIDLVNYRAWREISFEELAEYTGDRRRLSKREHDGAPLEWIGHENPQEPVYGSHGQVIGYEDALTVNIKETPQSNRSAPNHNNVTRYSAIGRRLLHVPKQLEDVLSNFYGDHGESYTVARLDIHGKPVPMLKGMDRLCSVYALTPAGIKWLARVEAKRVEKGQPDLGLSANERMRNEIRAAITKKDGVNANAMARIKAEALAMLKAACRAWNATAPESER